MITRVEDAVNDFIDQNKNKRRNQESIWKGQRKGSIFKKTIDPNDPAQDFNVDPNSELDPKYGDQVQEQAMAMVRGKQRFPWRSYSVFSILQNT